MEVALRAFFLDGTAKHGVVTFTHLRHVPPQDTITVGNDGDTKTNKGVEYLILSGVSQRIDLDVGWAVIMLDGTWRGIHGVPEQLAPDVIRFTLSPLYSHSTAVSQLLL